MEKSKKPYKKPVLTAIKLDPEQAIVSVCAVARGADGWCNAGAFCYYNLGGLGGKCRTTPKGATTGYGRDFLNWIAKPS